MALNSKSSHLPPLPFKPKVVNQTILDLSWQDKNIENMIGATQVPLGVAGPVEIPDLGKFVVPLATTEAALVASVNRGLKTLRQATHLQIAVRYAGMTRGPIFEAGDLKTAIAAGRAIKTKLVPLFKQRLKDISQHTNLIKIQTQVLGRYLFVRFRFDTDEAMGMNMTTYAATALSEIISRQLGLKLTTVSANFCSDKKLSFSNFFFGRGYQVWLEAVISQNSLKNILKTNIDNLVKVYQQKIWYGTSMAGGFSFNAQVANVIAAFYLATGQDLGHVADNSQATLVMEKPDKDLYLSLFLPNLNIGVVGGGTKLPCQKEAIDLVLKGLNSEYAGKKSAVLASVLAAAAAAGELSLLAALSTNTLACAHKTLSGYGKGDK